MPTTWILPMRCVGGPPRVFCPAAHRPLIRSRNGTVERRRCVRRWAATVPGGEGGFVGGGGDGMGGNDDGGGDDSFSNGNDGGDGDSFPMKFNLFAALSLIAHDPPQPKLPFFIIAETTDGEGQEGEVQQEEEEEEYHYVKPAPQPKAESMDYKTHASWMLILLLLSGGLFLWRRRRNQQPTYDENGAEEDEVLAQRTREIQVDAVGECTVHTPAQESRETAGQSSDAQKEEDRATPDLIKELEEHDELFDVEREVSVERQLSGVEHSLSVDTETAVPVEPDASDALPETPAFDLKQPPKEFEATEVPSAETFIQDLDDKDELFRDERMTESKTERETGPASPRLTSPQQPASNLVKVQLTVDKDQDSVNLELLAAATAAQPPSESKALENGVSERSLTSPPPPFTSQTDEGSNQSSSTHLSEDGILNEATDYFMSPPSTIAEEEDDQEEFDFDKQPPIKCPVIEDDLGPAIVPTAIDFSKPSAWEDAVNAKGVGKASSLPSRSTDEKTYTMQYLMSNPDLLTEALKLMETGSVTKPGTAVTSMRAAPSLPDPPKTNNGSAKKKKKRRSKANKTTANERCE